MISPLKSEHTSSEKYLYNLIARTRESAGKNVNLKQNFDYFYNNAMHSIKMKYSLQQVLDTEVEVNTPLHSSRKWFNG